MSIATSAAPALPPRPLPTPMFAPQSLQRTNGGARARLLLDAREPLLADHRPGGVPLLPTAMCLEALASGCALLRPGESLEALDVEVGPPCLVTKDSTTTAWLLLEGPASTDGGLTASLCSGPTQGPGTVHLRARFMPLEPGLAGGLPDAAALDASRLATPIPGSLVYRQFFHGPAYQVVGSVGWQGARLVARLAPGLPPLRHGEEAADAASHSGRTVLAPRLLELALQSAGMLEIARSGRSMIPHAMGRVQHLLPLDEYSGIPMLAIARAGEADAIDIDVCTGDGRCALRVRGYRTAPLPFASDARSLAALTTALRSGRESRIHGA
ncbi:MAG: hypothetical protein RL684_1901, partial [Pseudomonadota bacterium]